MSIAVIGGAGYIGSHTVRALLDAGRDVLVIDNLQTGHRESVPDGVRLYEGDIRDEAFLEKVFAREQIHAVIHFAACSVVPESMRDPLKYYDNNLGGAITLVRTMVRYGADKIVFSSTAAVYGEPECLPIAEDSRISPTNTYGETKYAMERLFHWAAQAHGLRYVSLRYFNACGAHPQGDIGEDHDPETHLIPLILQVPLGKRQNLRIFGTDYPTQDGSCVRDYIHVSDLSDAHVLALSYLEQGGKSDIFNLGNGVGFTVCEVLDCARRVTGHPIPAEEAPRRAGDPAALVASSEKARHVLGWQPKLDSLEDIIATAWAWHKNHPEGF